MSIESIEQAYEAMYKSVELQQKILKISFYEAYVENLSTILDNYKWSEIIEEKANKEDLKELRGLYEQLESVVLTEDEKRKVTQLVLLKGSTIEPLQPNHQITPDSLGFLIVFLMEQLSKKKELTLLDPAVGSGNLLATALLNLGNGKIKSKGIGVEIDELLLAIADVNAEWLNLPVHFYHQDGLQPLLINPVDMVLSDLPVGYYPLDDKAKEFKVASESEHTYAHHLLMEASMKYLTDQGFAFFLVPTNILNSGQAEELKRWLSDEVYVQAILQLPESMFKSVNGQKSIMILQNRTEKTKQAEVLVANVPSLASKYELQNFFAEFEEWRSKEF